VIERGDVAADEHVVAKAATEHGDATAERKEERHRGRR
jgi:hypothetical protein